MNRSGQRKVMKRRYAICILSFIIFACSSVPFTKTVYTPLGQVEPVSVLSSYREKVPDEINLLNTIVFEYRWRKFSGIGQVTADMLEKTFAVVCINPMGVKLFEISGDKDTTNSRFVMEPLSKKGDIAKAVGEDIRRIYFDLIPQSNAESIKSKYKLIFKQAHNAGIIEYVFAGVDGYLIEKKYYEDGDPVWGVSYYEYRIKGGKLYPGGIILNNFKYNYRLIVRLKEVQDNESH